MGFHDIYLFFLVWAVRPPELAVNTLLCHQGSLWDRVRAERAGSFAIRPLYHSVPLSVKCCAASATFWLNTLGFSGPKDLVTNTLKIEETADISSYLYKLKLWQKWEKNTNMRTILHIILQNSKTLPTVIEQCTTKDNTSRLQCPWFVIFIFTKMWNDYSQGSSICKLKIFYHIT